jgi:TPR repeat protein
VHQNGQGGPVSMEQARVWYGRAAEQGHASAQCNLAVMHENGEGGPVSLEHAIFWIKCAAAQGDNEAMHCVQQMKSMCSFCGKPRSASGENMKTCSGCKCAIYCSEVCQRAHWKKGGGHKTMCKKIRALHVKMAGGATGSSESAGGGAGESKTSAGGGGAGEGAKAAKTKKKEKKKKKKKKKAK